MVKVEPQPAKHCALLLLFRHADPPTCTVAGTGGKRAARLGHVRGNYYGEDRFSVGAPIGRAPFSPPFLKSLCPSILAFPAHPSYTSWRSHGLPPGRNAARPGA